MLNKASPKKAYLSLSIMYCKGGANAVLKIRMIHQNHAHNLTINFALNKALLDHKFLNSITRLVDTSEH